MFKNFLKIAGRNLLKHKAFTFINVLGLTMGVCACLGIWLLTRFELSFEQFHPDKERIYRIVSEIRNKGGEVNHWGDVPEPTAAQARIELTGLETIANFHNYNASVSIPDGHGGLKKFPNVSGGLNNNELIFAEPQYFELFKYDWLAGDPTTLKEPFHVVLSVKGAQKYFGDAPLGKILGRQLIYDDSLPVTVTGIVKDWNKNTDCTFTNFISYPTIKASFVKSDIPQDQWGNFSSSSETFVKLAKGTTASRIEKELIGFSSRHLLFDKDQTYKMLLQPLSDLHFSAEYDKDYGREAHLPTLYGLMGISAFILIIASINFINLSTAQALQRAKEIGIRKVLGSSRSSLIIQFLGETFLLTLLALLISLIVVRPVLFAFPSFIPKELTLRIFDLATIGFIVGVLLLTTLISGFYPAWILSSYLPVRALKMKGNPKGTLRNRFRKGLIVFQFSVSLVFIIASIVIGNQIRFMLNKDMGFTKNAIITFGTNGKEPENKRHLLAESIRSMAGVEKISMDWFTPAFSGAATTTIEYSGPSLIKTDVNFRIGDEQYIPLYGLKMIAGRNYFHSDTLRELVINETCAKILGFVKPQEALGKSLKMWGKSCSIVGVVSDFNIKPLHEAIGPVVIGPEDDREYGYSVQLQTLGKSVTDFNNTIAAIDKDWRAIFPNEVFEYHFFDDTIAKFYSKEQQTSQVIIIAMFIAIFISCMGLFGLAALSAEQRTKEIGVRKVLGAGIFNIVALMSKEFLTLVLIALLIAVPVAWYFMHRWLRDFAYRIPISGWVFLFAGSAAVFIAFITISFHTIKAANANPVTSLRSE
jgi:putative ABC transport system permease protein